MAHCTYKVPDKEATGDNLYGPRSCYQPFIDWAWDAFNFNFDYWQNGWGYDDPCNTDKPLARTFNGLWALTYSAEDWEDESYGNDNMLNWGGRYVREQMSPAGEDYDLRARCGDKVAATFGAGCTSYREHVTWGCTDYRDNGYSACDEWDKNCCDWWPCSWGCKLITWICVGWVWISSWVCVAFGYITSWICEAGNAIVTRKRIELYNDAFFYDQDVAVRASTMVHEARHIDGKAHVANFPSWSSYGAGESGADPSWSYSGAWMWETVWLWWYAAHGKRANLVLRQRARDEAQVYIDNAFEEHPGLVIPAITA